MPKHDSASLSLLCFLRTYWKIETGKNRNVRRIHPPSLSSSSSLQEASCIRIGLSGTHFRRDSLLLPFQRWKPRDESGARAASSVFAYRYGEITMARGILIDIGRRPPVLLSARTRPLVRELSRETAAIILSRRNWFGEESLPARPALAMLIRSYKPIFTLHIGSADWWYTDGKPVRRW